MWRLIAANVVLDEVLKMLADGQEIFLGHGSKILRAKFCQAFVGRSPIGMSTANGSAGLKFGQAPRWNAEGERCGSVTKEHVAAFL